MPAPKPSKRFIPKRHGNSVFKDTMYVEAYRLSRQGLTNPKIAKGLGISIQCFNIWMRENKAFGKAVRLGRSEKARNFQASWRDYVYKSLSPELKEVWDEINELDESTSSIARLEALLEDGGVKMRQHLFLYALPDANFNASEACRKVNISYNTLQNWMRNDEGFSQLVDQMHWHKGNFFESGLVQAVRDGDTKAIIFANKTFNKGRGYSEKLEIEHSGQVAHTHTIDVDSLDLPLDVKVQILEAVRKKRKQAENTLEAEVLEPALTLEEDDE